MLSTRARQQHIMHGNMQISSAGREHKDAQQRLDDDVRELDDARHDLLGRCVGVSFTICVYMLNAC